MLKFASMVFGRDRLSDLTELKLCAKDVLTRLEQGFKNELKPSTR